MENLCKFLIQRNDMKRHLFQDDNSLTVYVCVYVLGRRKGGYADNIKKAKAEAVRKERTDQI